MTNEIAPSVAYRSGPLTSADYDEAIAILRDGRDQQPDRCCAACGDTGHLAAECHHNPLVLARAYVGRPDKWRCFFCGFSTSDPAEAEAHFGEPMESPTAVCQDWAELNADGRLQAYQDTIRELDGERERLGEMVGELDQARAEQHRGEAERHQLRKEIGEALGEAARFRAALEQIRDNHSLDPRAWAGRVLAGIIDPLMFAAAVAPLGTTRIAPPQWGLRPCRQCGKECYSTWCSTECWEKAKRSIEEGDPVLPGPGGQG